MSKENNRPIGLNSPNLVALFQLHMKTLNCSHDVTVTAVLTTYGCGQKSNCLLLNFATHCLILPSKGIILGNNRNYSSSSSCCSSSSRKDNAVCIYLYRLCPGCNWAMLPMNQTRLNLCHPVYQLFEVPWYALTQYKTNCQFYAFTFHSLKITASAYIHSVG
jgi:hypothetical protein